MALLLARVVSGGVSFPPPLLLGTEMKRLIATFGVVLFAATINAGVVLGGSFASFSEDNTELGDDFDIRVNGVLASVGYAIESTNSFSFIPELRIGRGVSKETMCVLDVCFNLSIDRAVLLGLRAQYQASEAAYIYLAPTYAKLRMKAEVDGVSECAAIGGCASETEDGDEFGFAIGGGVDINDGLMLDFSYERYDSTNTFTVGLRKELKGL